MSENCIVSDKVDLHTLSIKQNKFIRRSAKMRLFISIDLSDEMKNEIIATMHEMKAAGVKGAYVPKQNLHLTLAFIGETSDAATVKEALSGISIKPFRFSFSDLGSFGDLVYIGMKGNQGLSAAVKNVRDALDRFGIKYDTKKFVPHITIIRKAAGAYRNVKAPSGEMMVKKISLMKSEEKAGKRIYTEIFSAANPKTG